MRATVVVPTYNESANLPALVDQVRAAVPGIRMLIVDDGSPDGTADLAEQLGRERGGIDVLRRTSKDGLGAAYRAGLRRAIDDGAELCVQMDADLSHPPSALPGMLAIAEHDIDLVIGSRYVPGGRTVDWPYTRRLLSRWGNRYASGVLGLAVNDATAGYRVYRTSILTRMQFETVQANGYGFQVEMTYRLINAGGSVVEYPIAFRDRTAGQSKMSGGIIREAFGLVLKLRAEHWRRRHERRSQGG